MVPIEQKDWTKEDRAAIGQNHPLDSTKRLKTERVDAPIGADIETVLRRDERLQMSQTA
jgi:hypothetical protein